MARQPEENRYQNIVDIIDLAMTLQAQSMTLDDICEAYTNNQGESISRRTAERRLHAVRAIFPSIEPTVGQDRRTHWRLKSKGLRSLVQISNEEIVELDNAVIGLTLMRNTRGANLVSSLRKKIQALNATNPKAESEQELEALLQAEGLATRPGPRQEYDTELIYTIREAMGSGRVIAFKYNPRNSDQVSKRLVKPYGVLYASRPLLVGPEHMSRTIKTWRLSGIRSPEITQIPFTRNTRFNLQKFSKRSFGVFQEQPFNVVLSFPDDMKSELDQWIFHPDQIVSKRRNETVTVRFKAGGALEML